MTTLAKRKFTTMKGAEIVKHHKRLKADKEHGENLAYWKAYRVDPDKPLWSDFFVPEGTPEVEPVVMMTGMSI